jgi:hypothetical protein
LSLDWHRGPTVSLAKLSFAEHAALAAQHNGKDRWEYRRLDVFAVEASRHAKSVRGQNIPSGLSWLDQQGLNVGIASKDGTTDDVLPFYPSLILDGPSSSLQIHNKHPVSCARKRRSTHSRPLYFHKPHIHIIYLRRRNLRPSRQHNNRHNRPLDSKITPLNTNFNFPRSLHRHRTENPITSPSNLLLLRDSTS